jgi:hypothetical protein
MNINIDDEQKIIKINNLTLMTDLMDFCSKMGYLKDWRIQVKASRKKPEEKQSVILDILYL